MHRRTIISGAALACVIATAAIVPAALADPFDDAPRLARCDDRALMTAVREAIAANIQLRIRAVSAIRSVSRTTDAGVCMAHVVATTGEEDEVTYTLTLHGSGTNFLITDVTQTSAPTTPSPGAAP